MVFCDKIKTNLLILSLLGYQLFKANLELKSPAVKIYKKVPSYLHAIVLAIYYPLMRHQYDLYDKDNSLNLVSFMQG